jgi:hypothetical protein
MIVLQILQKVNPNKKPEITFQFFALTKLMIKLRIRIILFAQTK